MKSGRLEILLSAFVIIMHMQYYNGYAQPLYEIHCTAWTRDS